MILHGTDTMAYTASALSFMCENLGKPIILTGSQVATATMCTPANERAQDEVFFLQRRVFPFQVPIYEMRNDGLDNLLGALLIAGQFVIPEVRQRRRVVHADRWDDVSLRERNVPVVPQRGGK